MANSAAKIALSKLTIYISLKEAQWLDFTEKRTYHTSHLMSAGISSSSPTPHVKISGYDVKSEKHRYN